jgi:acyl carrier protein phosphodiesterase
VNYLAHILLSGENDLILVGNFMGDGVKGSQLDYLHPEVEAGVRLHRAIDSYTDQHPITADGRSRLRPKCGKYAGVVLDMIYDHILAANWVHYHDEPLDSFVARKYEVLERNIHHMPDRIQYMLPYMIAGDWLGNYANISGLATALNGVSKRAKAGAFIAGSEYILQENTGTFKTEFDQLFSDLFEMSNTMLTKLGHE